MTEHTIDPQAIVDKLTSENVKLNLVHIHAEYDDCYAIWYTKRLKRFQVRLEVSVWDGRGHESYKETLDEPTLRARLEEISTTGKVVSFYYESRK